MGISELEEGNIDAKEIVKKLKNNYNKDEGDGKDE